MPRRASATKKLNISTDLEPNSTAAEAQNASHKSGDTTDSRTAPNVPQHRQPQPQMQHFINPIGDKPRDEQIRLVLDHRKLLLKRIRQSKAAAENRLANPTNRSIAAILEEIKPGGAVRDEVEGYAELTRLAVAAAKKQRQDELQPAEKRASTLRRGNSVGKRITQAVSVLAPGANDLATSVEPIPPPPPPSAVLPLPAIPTMGTKKLKTATSIGKQMGESKKRASTKKATPRPMISAPPPYNLPTVVVEAPPPPKASVKFPEAIALRERKAVVMQKLNALLEERRKEMEKDINPKLAQRLTSLAKGASLLPSSFPKRRKTQWDFVMEEMRWLATDFVEERKWKVSSGRILSCAIMVEHKEKANKLVVAAIKDEPVKDSDGDAIMEEGTELSCPPLESEADTRSLKGQLFVNPSAEDIVVLKHHAKRLSGMVSDLWDGVLESGVQWKEVSGTLGEAEKKVETNLVRDTSEQTSEVATTSGVVSPDDVEIEANEERMNLQSTALPYETVTERIKSLLDRIERRPRHRTRSKQSSNRAKMTLTPVEQKASDFIDFLWRADKPTGSIMGDASSFSPFDVVTYLLRQTKNGPHLILCPSSRIFRWKSEFKIRNPKGRVLLFSNDSFGVATAKDLIATDVVIADLSCVERRLDISAYESVILDGNVSLGTSKNISSKEVREAVMPELLSESWWNTLLRSLSTKNQRRLMIANSLVIYDIDDDGGLLHRLTQKERLGLVAGMTCFAFGPDLFESSGKSPLHRALAWAKNEVKAKNGKVKGRPKIQHIENHLVDILSKLLFAPESQFETVQQSFEEKSIFDTEVTLCKMSSSQQAAYDSLCRSLRGALSLGGSLVEAARGFIQLREVCFHARLREVCDLSITSTSQPDLQKAIDIMNESAKLKELVALLHRDFGYDIEGGDILENQVPALQPKSKRNSKAMKDGLPKVLILASSPLVQRLTSMLLSFLGICHDNLSGTLGGSGDHVQSIDSNVKNQVSDKETKRKRAPWLDNQLALLRYNNIDVDSRGIPFPSADDFVTPRAVNILLGSALDVAKKGNGLSVEASDIVIFLDEDWSGRESQLVKQMLVRCFLHRARHEDERGDFRVYRFICDDCCEEKLLCGSEENGITAELDETDWAVDCCGLLELKEALESKDESFSHWGPDYIFHFPGRNLVSFRNQPLAAFLGTKEPLPSNLESGKDLMFLPFGSSVFPASGSGEKKMILAFAGKLISEEIILRSEATLPPLQDKNGNTDLTTQRMFISSTQYYIERFEALSSSRISSTANSSFHDDSLYIGSDMNVAKRDTAGLIDQSNSSANSFLCDSFSASILFYDSNDSGSSKLKRKMGDLCEPRKSSRSNVFATAFSNAAVDASSSARDGAQGCEPLVYFPPVFPLLRQVATGAAMEVSRIQQDRKRLRVHDIQGSDGLKLPSEGAVNADPKRPRLETLDSTLKTVGQVLPASTALQVPGKSISSISVVPASSLGSGGSVTKTPAPQVSATPFNGSLNVQSEAQISFDLAKQTLADIDEDFGIIGVGALPIRSQSSREATLANVGLTDYCTVTSGLANHSLLSSTLACDFEEVESVSTGQAGSDLGAVILFVPRKSAPVNTVMYPSSLTPGGHPQMTQWNPSGASFPAPSFMVGPGLNGMTGDMKPNGAIGNKKPKKKSVTPTSFATGTQGFPGRPGTDFPMNPQGLGMSTSINPSKGKDALRYKILASYGRPGYGSPGLLESSQFRSASLRVRNRILGRVSSSLSIAGHYAHQQANQLSTEQPSQNYVGEHSPPHWMSGVTMTGRNENQEEAARYNQSDFGPFQVGSLLSVGEIISVPHGRPGVGLGLPMGVKIPPQRSNQPPKPWTESEDKRLHMLTLKFGMNWHLVAGSLARKNRAPFRSARQCRERWHILAKVNATLFNDMLDSRNSDMAALKLTEPSDDGETQVEGQQYVKISSDMPMEAGEEGDIPNLLRTKSVELDAVLAPLPSNPPEVQASADSPKERRSFASFRLAAAKKTEVPLSIPGVVAGQRPSLAASHPSHHQSLQAAVSALSPGGRTEMWPLQILDLADRQRRVARESNR